MVPVTAPVHRLSVDDVYRMVEAGVLDEDDRLELVEGVLVEMVPIGAEHDGALAWLNRHFSRIATEAWEVRVQSVLLTAGGYLLPDLTLVTPMSRTAQPSTAHLVVEVAQTSQTRDLVKAGDYAAADVSEYWIVDLPGRSVTVHR
jgi:Uma2 family endonuclease